MIKENNNMRSTVDSGTPGVWGKPMFSTMGQREMMAKLGGALEAEGFRMVGMLDIGRVMESDFKTKVSPYETISVFHPDIVKRMFDDKVSLAMGQPWTIQIRQVGERTQIFIPDPLMWVKLLPESKSWTEIALDLQAKLGRVVEKLGALDFN